LKWKDAIADYELGGHRSVTGKTAFVSPYEEGAIASSLMIVWLHDKKLGKFIFRYLVSPFGRSHIFRFDNGSAQGEPWQIGTSTKGVVGLLKVAHKWKTVICPLLPDFFITFYMP